MSGARPEPGRRLLDEALRLLDVAQATRPAGAGQGGSGSAAPECRNCPLCRGIAYLREVDPEAVERLTGAVADVTEAVRDLLGAAPAPAAQRPAEGAAADASGTGGDAPVPRVRVQRIDVTD